MSERPKIPEFKSLEEEMEYWDTHNGLEFLEDDESNVVEIDASGLRQWREERKAQQISLRVSRPILERTRNRAKALGIPYQTLIQLWIAERLEKEEAMLRSLAGESAKPRRRTAPRSRTTAP